MKGIGLRKRVILPLIFSGIIIFVLGNYFVFKSENTHLNNTVLLQSKSMQQHLHSVIEAKTEVMAANLRFIALDAEILTALKSSDRDTLLALSAPLYKRLNQAHNITHFYFHDAQRINLLRTHKSERYGDRIDRYTALGAEKTASLSSGIELGALGTFTLRAVLPVFEQDQLLGYIELGLEIEELIQQARNIFGFELFILIDKTFLDRKEWEAGMKMLNRHYNWEQLSSAVLISQSLPDIPKTLFENASIQRSDEVQLQQAITLNNSRYAIAVIPVKDAGKHQLATLVMLQDITQLSAGLKTGMIVFNCLTLGIGLFIIVLFFILLGRTEKKLLTARQRIIDDGKEKHEMQAVFIQQLQKEQALLRASEERFEKISSSAQDAIICIDNDGNISYWNAAAEKIFGYTEQQVLGQDLHQLITPERYREAQTKAFSQFQKTGKGDALGKTLELEGVHKDGSEFPVELSLSSIQIDGKWTGVGILRDISERKQAQLDIERALHIQQVLDTILNISLPALTLKEVLFKSLDAVLAIPAFSLLHKGAVFMVAEDGQTLEMVAQRNLPDPLLQSCAKLAFGKCLCGKAAATRELVFSDHIDERHEITFEGIKPHGHYCIPIMSEDILLGVLNIYIPAEHKSDAEERRYLKTVADTMAVVIERKTDEQALIQLAHHDELTGLPNRTLFYDRLEQIIARSHRHKEKFSLLFLDLDHFKEINDTLGHDAGDLVLKEASTRLLGCVKRKTDMVARMGGDEFTIILPSLNAEQEAKFIAEKVIKAISLPFELEGQEYTLGCSIGIAFYPDNGEDSETLIKHADDAMYVAKRQRNIYCLYSDKNSL
mgnify:FL=1